MRMGQNLRIRPHWNTGARMKIVSLDESRTVSPFEIACNIEGAFDEEVVSRANQDLRNVKLSIEGDVLQVKAAKEPIDAQLIQALNQTLEVAVAWKNKNHDDAADKRRRMLQTVTANTGLQFK